MHHCVGTYGDEVRRGNCYVYSIRRNDERVATVALCSHNGRAYLEQIRGRCNTEPPKAIVATMVRWLHSQRPLPPCKAIEATLGTDLKSKNGNFKSGDWTAGAIAERKWLRSLVQSFAKSGATE